MSAVRYLVMLVIVIYAVWRLLSVASDADDMMDEFIAAKKETRV